MKQFYGLRKKLNLCKRLLIDSFFPWNTCLVCGGKTLEKSCVCSQCSSKLSALPRCKICGCFFDVSYPREHSMVCPGCVKESKKYVDAFYSALPYADKTRDYVLALKYHNKQNYAAPLANCLSEYLKEQEVKADCVIAVPLHDKRFAERGYNQAELLAEKVAQNLDIPYIPRVLKRHKETKVQYLLSFNERKTNLADAFSIDCNCDRVKGKVVILIDDIMTSGTTVMNCAKVLKNLGVKEVYAAAVTSHVIKI